MRFLTKRFGNRLILTLAENRHRRQRFKRLLHDTPNVVCVRRRALVYSADLKRGYGRRLCNASGITALLMVVLFWSYPEYEPTVFLRDTPVAVVLLPDIPATTQYVRAPSMPRPQVPLAVEGQEVPEDVTIESTELNFDQVAVDWGVNIPGLPGGTWVGDGGEEILEVADIDYKPHPVRIVTPAYPIEARKRRLEGEVMVRVLVEKDGRVSRVEVVGGPEGLQKKRPGRCSAVPFSSGQAPG